MNQRLLKSKMVLFGDTIEALSTHLECSPVTLGNKLNKYPLFCFDQREIATIITRYSLTPNEVMEIFFTEVNDETK